MKCLDSIQLYVISVLKISLIYNNHYCKSYIFIGKFCYRENLIPIIIINPLIAEPKSKICNFIISVFYSVLKKMFSNT